MSWEITLDENGNETYQEYSDSHVNDWGGGSSAADWFNQNGTAVMGFGTNLINGFLAFGASIYATKNKTTPTYPKPGGTGGSGSGSGNGGDQPAPTNWLLWIIVVFVILAILFGIFLMVRNNKGGNS